MARTSWSRYGIAPTGDPKTRAFRVTAEKGVTVQGKHYPQGATMPRRQGENLRLVQESDWSSWDEMQRAHAGSGSFRDYPDWVRKGAAERDRTESAQRSDPDFNRRYLQWKRAGRPRANDPNGKLANLLVEVGLRPAGATYRVGRSPGYKQRGKIDHRRAA
jgi:hypothetical protein